jgi:transposase
LTDPDHARLVAGLRSPDAFVLRRCQIRLASARGDLARVIAGNLGCGDQTVRNAIAAFNARGLACLELPSSRPRTSHAAFPLDHVAGLRALLHQSPRAFGRPTSLWTLGLAATVSFERGLTVERVTGETVRATLARLGVRWQHAQEWITSPGPAYARKKERAIAGSACCEATLPGRWASPTRPGGAGSRTPPCTPGPTPLGPGA